MKQHGYGTRHKDWTFDNLTAHSDVNSIAIGGCRDYVDSFRSGAAPSPHRSLLIQGGTGRGKTCLAVAMFKDLLAYGCDVEFWSTLEWVGTARDLRGDRASALTAMDAEILILDDLGTERDPVSIDMIYAALHPRLALGRPTVLLTAMSLGDLESRYGMWFTDMLKSDFGVADLTGPDRRLEKSDPETRRLIEEAGRDRRPERGAK